MARIYSALFSAFLIHTKRCCWPLRWEPTARGVILLSFPGLERVVLGPGEGGSRHGGRGFLLSTRCFQTPSKLSNTDYSTPLVFMAPPRLPGAPN